MKWATAHREIDMPQSYVNLLYHIVFATKNREPLITGKHQERLYEYIGGIVREQGGIALALNGTEDHVHLFAKLRQDKALSDMIRDFKAHASGWMHKVFPELEDFSWQNGYGAFTVSASQAAKVRQYIAGQKIRHQQYFFENEFVKLLQVNEVEFDERYLWR